MLEKKYIYMIIIFFNPKKSVLIISVYSYIYIVLHICDICTQLHMCKHILLHMLAHWDIRRSVK